MSKIDRSVPLAPAVGAQVQRPVRPLLAIAWLASTPDGEYALALTKNGAIRRSGGSVDDVAPLTLQAVAQAEIDRLRLALLAIATASQTNPAARRLASDVLAA